VSVIDCFLLLHPPPQGLVLRIPQLDVTMSLGSGQDKALGVTDRHGQDSVLLEPDLQAAGQHPLRPRHCELLRYTWLAQDLWGGRLIGHPLVPLVQLGLERQALHLPGPNLERQVAEW